MMFFQDYKILSKKMSAVFQQLLGHIVSKDGVSMDPKKKECIRNWLVSNNIKEVKSLIVFRSYYHNFMFIF